MTRTPHRPLARLIGGALLATIALGAPARAEVPARAYADVNRALTDGVVLPAYRKLSAAANGFRMAVERACKPGATENLAAARLAYHRTMDAWMRVQPIGFGPIELFMRNFRLHFWPAAGSRVEKTVDEMLSGTNPINAETLRQAGVAVQGLPAAELLLFGKHAKALKPGNRSCTLLVAIAGNMDDIARAIVADWTGGKIAFRRALLNPGPKNDYFSTHQEASLAFFKSLYQALELIVTAKLGPVAGTAKAKGSISDLESVVSGRSLRNMVLNIEAAEALYLGAKNDGFTAIVRSQTADPKLDPLMRRAFRLTLATARSIRPPLARALTDPAQRKRVEKFLLQTRALKQIVATRLTKALDLTVGFNANDGD